MARQEPAAEVCNEWSVPAALITKPFSSLWNPDYVPAPPLPANPAGGSLAPPTHRPAAPAGIRSSRHFGCTLQSVRRSLAQALVKGAGQG